MQYTSLLDYLPLWLMLLLTIGIAVASLAGGYRLGAWRRNLVDPENADPVGAMVAATLGLLAFILAFTFGLASTRYDDRREIVMDEANAIGTTYLRAEMLVEPHRSEVRRLLREYVDARLKGSQFSTLQQALAKSTDLQNQLWTHAVAIARREPDSIVMEMFTEALNDVIDIHSKRVMFGLRNRIPGSIWLALYVVSILGMLLIGYHEGLVSKRRSPAMIGLVITFTTVMILIADLDRSGEGWLLVSQEPMLDLRNSFETPSPRVE